MLSWPPTNNMYSYLYMWSYASVRHTDEPQSGRNSCLWLFHHLHPSIDAGWPAASRSKSTPSETLVVSIDWAPCRCRHCICYFLQCHLCCALRICPKEFLHCLLSYTCNHCMKEVHCPGSRTHALLSLLCCLTILPRWCFAANGDHSAFHSVVVLTWVYTYVMWCKSVNWNMFGACCAYL